MVGDRRAPAKQSDVGQSFRAADHDRLLAVVSPGRALCPPGLKSRLHYPSVFTASEPRGGEWFVEREIGLCSGERVLWRGSSVCRTGTSVPADSRTCPRRIRRPGTHLAVEHVGTERRMGMRVNSC